MSAYTQDVLDQMWACSVVACEGERAMVAHVVLLLTASTEDEATGAALRVARQQYPPEQGYTNHSVVVHNVGAFAQLLDSPVRQEA